MTTDELCRRTDMIIRASTHAHEQPIMFTYTAHLTINNKHVQQLPCALSFCRTEHCARARRDRRCRLSIRRRNARQQTYGILQVDTIDNKTRNCTSGADTTTLAVPTKLHSTTLTLGSSSQVKLATKSFEREKCLISSCRHAHLPRRPAGT